MKDIYRQRVPDEGPAKMRGSGRPAWRLAALALVVTGLSGCGGCWQDFRKRVTLRYEEHAETLEWKAEQKKKVESYDVVSEEAGSYKIPVSVAMTLVAADPALLAPVVEVADDISGLPLAQQGEHHFKITYACAACHDLQGERKVGPPLNNRWGKEAPLEGGEVVTFDDEYFRESVLYSQAKVARGYPPAMPVFNEQMSQADFEAIKAYVKQFQ